MVVGILGIVLSMVYVKKTKKVKKVKETMKNNSKKMNSKKNKKVEGYTSSYDNKECNRILVEKEKKCNCFDSKGNPSNDQSTCMKINHRSECQDYNKCKNRFLSYMSGSEPMYNVSEWEDPLIEGSHNCYAYFLDDHIPEIKNKCKSYCKKFVMKDGKKVCSKKPSECNDLKPQPGDIANKKGNLSKNDPEYTCDAMIHKVLIDNIDDVTHKNNITTVKFNEKCPVNHYKGAVVVHPGKTYHFYRQDKNGRFSHKQGVLKVENVDASGNPIWAPHYADRDYKKLKKEGINYTDFCTYFCIPKNYFKKTHAI